MRTILSKFLLLLMTITGIFMPIHAYAHEISATQDSHYTTMDTSHDTDGASKSCDHCCHFSSHSLGLMRVCSKIDELPNIFISTIQNQIYSSLNQPPPYHPPIA
jgi:hypothetical protein